MSWKNFTVDDSITRFGTGEGLIHVLEGNYLLQLQKIEPSPEDRDYAGEKGEPQLPYWAFHLGIEDGPDGLGKVLRYGAMFSPTKEDGSGGAWSVGRVLHALGADPSKLVNASFASYQQFAAYAKQVETVLLKAGSRGKTGAEVSDSTSVNPRNGKVQVISNITGFFKPEEWLLRKQSNGVPHPSPAASPTPVSPSTNGLAASPSPAPAAATGVETDMEALVAQIMGAAAP